MTERPPNLWARIGARLSYLSSRLLFLAILVIGFAAALLGRRKPSGEGLNRVLLVRMDAMGDYVLMRNFLPALRAAPRFAGKPLVLAGSAAFKGLAEGFDSGLFDSCLWVDRPRFTKDLGYALSCIRQVRSVPGGFGIALHPSYSRDYVGDLLVLASGAPARIGVDGEARATMRGVQAPLKALLDRIYTERLPAGAGVMHEFERNREMFAALCGAEAVASLTPHLDASGVPSPLGAGASSSLPAGAPSPLAMGAPYAVVFPGSSATGSFKRWSPERYAQVCDHLHRRGLKVVVAGGPGERALAAEILPLCKEARPLDLAGQTSLPQLASLLAGARLLVSNDTGPFHLGVAVGVPTVCIATGYQYGRFYPYPVELAPQVRYALPDVVEAEASTPQGAQALYSRFDPFSAPAADEVAVEKVERLADELLEI